MALAETASIFCETIMVQAGLAAADDQRRLALLNVDLQGACQVVVDIHSRFLFEQRMCQQRQKADAVTGRAVRPDDRGASWTTYGDGLDPATLHPYMWAVKPHYYGSAFYNWPYCFGLLFGTGLYARYRQDPERFRAHYDDLLSATGLATASALAAALRHRHRRRGVLAGEPGGDPGPHRRLRAAGRGRVRRVRVRRVLVGGS